MILLVDLWRWCQLVEVAEEAIRALARGLPRAVSQPDDLKAPHQNPYGVPDLPDKALGGTTMGLDHKLGYVLGGKYHLPHAGVHHSALLPQVAAFNAPAGAGALGRAARALGVRGPEAVGPALFDLADQLRAPTSPADLGPGGRRHRGGRRDRLHSLYLESADLYAARSRLLTEAGICR
jgi:maleylacetate reductase